MEINDSNDTPYKTENEKTLQDEREKALVNSSGHVQEIDRTFSVTSLCLTAVLTDNVCETSMRFYSCGRFQELTISRPGALGQDRLLFLSVRSTRPGTLQ